MDTHLSLDMSLSREEFFRLLPGAVGPFSCTDGGQLRGSEGMRHWTLDLFQLPDRCLGRVVLPQHRVNLAFEGYSQDEMEAFMVRFHRAFLRGGG